MSGDPNGCIVFVINCFFLNLNAMSNYCEDCGCKVYNGRCTNCHEGLYVEDQYLELDMELPNEDSEFTKKANECRKTLNCND